MRAVHSAVQITSRLSAAMSAVFALGVFTEEVHAQQGAARQAIARAREERLDDGAEELGRFALPPNVRLERDVAYGNDPRQRFDVYLPAKASRAPVMLLVHGGAWRIGDKSSRAVVANKVARWTRAGFIVISVNYRMLPAADPVEQARDVARAIHLAQQRLPSWGGDPDRVVLVGHSAGAHLVALLGADSRLIAEQGARPPIGTIILDSAALDVEQLMKAPHLRLYDAAFGSSRLFWRMASPYSELSAGASPFLLVCSTLRRDSCPEAAKFAKRAKGLGIPSRVIQEPLTHREINDRLGTAGAYTDSVEAFLRTLDYSIARALPESGK